MQQNLFDYAKERLQANEIRFNGSDYSPSKDDIRLTGQILSVYQFMMDGRWKTLAQIENAINQPQASISAQLRHLRKERFGSHIIEKRNLGYGLWEYRMLS